MLTLKTGVSRLLRLITWLNILLCLPLVAESDTDFRWTVGEQYRYQVKYAFLKVASVDLGVMCRDTLRGHEVYQVEMTVKSSRLPFVNIDSRFVSFVDRNLYTHAFLAWEKDGDRTYFTRYDFDYPAGELRLHTETYTATDSIVTLDSVATLTEKMQDGLSILFYARAFAAGDTANTLPVFAYNDRKETNIHFSGLVEDIKTHKGLIASHPLNGKMRFVGVGGLREDFQGWFSTDRQRVLLEARLKAVIGSVRLKLESWQNWEEDLPKPPLPSKHQIDHRQPPAA